MTVAFHQHLQAGRSFSLTNVDCFSDCSPAAGTVGTFEISRNVGISR
jgi:hypothetical protein